MGRKPTTRAGFFFLASPPLPSATNTPKQPTHGKTAPMSRTTSTFFPPIMEAQSWMHGLTFPDNRPLINVSQAAPVDPPPEPLRQAIADAAMNDAGAHLYGPVLGLPALREQIAEDWTRAYGGALGMEQVAITSGCNQAFCATLAMLTDEGDEIIMPTPWYFSYKMWTDMSGLNVVPLPAREGLLPDPEEARSLITDKTRAILLVTPNNPGGVEYPAELVHEFHEVAKSHGLTLIVDETYRDFDSRPTRPHDLFSDPDWEDSFIQIYSFSKAYRLTGHRVGAIIAGKQRILEIEKFLDTVTICPNQLGQRAALWGMRNLGDWLAGERLEILDRRAAITDHMPEITPQGWVLKGVGAYFAYLEHPYQMSSADLAKILVRDASVLLLPGTMFVPENDPSGPPHVRVAFANVDRAGIAALYQRLKAFEIHA